MRPTESPAIRQGRLVACEAATRRVTREERDGSMTVIASGFQGRRLNFPNDIVVKSDGAIYFTDPWTGPAAVQPPGETDQIFAGRLPRLRRTWARSRFLVNDFFDAERDRLLAR